MKVESREYKFLIGHERFTDVDAALEALWEEIEEAIDTLPGVRTKGRFDEKESRNVVFLDTPDQTFRRQGLILRRRWGGDDVEYTLKCRSEDRYFAAGTDVRAAGCLDAEDKFEEDIAPPFRCRFSRSVTISLSEERDPDLRDAPKNLREAAKLFPLLATLRVDGRPCSGETAVVPVNGIEVRESVWKGAKILFAPENSGGDAAKASVALILWSRGKRARPAVAELSFRVKGNGESFTRDQAAAAREVYRVLLRMDCTRSDGMTKTEYVYRDASTD